MILYLTYWFPAQYRARIVAVFMVAIPASSFLGSPLSVFCSRDEPYTEADARRYLELAREGRCPPYEWRRRNRDRSFSWFEVRLKPQ